MGRKRRVALVSLSFFFLSSLSLSPLYGVPSLLFSLRRSFSQFLFLEPPLSIILYLAILVAFLSISLPILFFPLHRAPFSFISLPFSSLLHSFRYSFSSKKGKYFLVLNISFLSLYVSFYMPIPIPADSVIASFSLVFSSLLFSFPLSSPPFCQSLSFS